MRPETIEECLRWLSRATNDLRSADLDLAAAPPIFEDAVLHCEEAVDKAMKALRTALDLEVREAQPQAGPGLPGRDTAAGN